MSPRTPDEIAIELVTHAYAHRPDEIADVLGLMNVTEVIDVLVEVLGVAAVVLIEADTAEQGAGQALLQRAAAQYLAAGLTP